MKKLSWLLFSAFTGSLVLSNSAFAYLDPGTGAAVVGSLIPLILAVCSAILAFLIKYFWKPIKNFFSKSKKQDTPGQENQAPQPVQPIQTDQANKSAAPNLSESKVNES